LQRGARQSCTDLDLERVVKLARLLSRTVGLAATPLQAVVQPSCRKLPHKCRKQSAEGAGKTEGKIEGDGTASRCTSDLHKDGHGTRWRMRRAALMPRIAPVLATPRAVCALVRPASTELST
jgi:hypothetical protein